PAGTRGAAAAGRSHDAAVGQGDVVAALQPAEERAFGDAELAGMIDIEGAAVVVFDHGVAEALDGVDERQGFDAIALAAMDDTLPYLADGDVEGRVEVRRLAHRFEVGGQALRAVDVERRGAAVEAEGGDEAG